MIRVIRTATTTTHLEVTEFRIREVKCESASFMLEMYGPKKNIIATEPYETNLALVARILQLTAGGEPIKL